MTWPDPLVIAAIATGVVTVIGSVVGGAITILKAIHDLKSTTAQKFDEQTIQVEAAKNHAENADNHAKTAANQVSDTHQKLQEINAKTSETLKNTDGNLSKLQNELERRSAREEVLERMVSELTTVISASRAASAQTSIPVGRRSTDPPISVKVIEDALRKEKETP